MRILFLLALILGLLSGLPGCSPAPSHSTGNFGESPRLLLSPKLSPLSRQTLLREFAAAHARADSVVKLALPAAEDWPFLTTTYGFSYPNWQASLTDTLPGPATEYTFYYGLLHQGDTIQSAVVSIGPDLRIYPSDLAELVAYQQFRQGELTVGRRKAVSLGTAYGLQQAGAEVTFDSEQVLQPDTLPSLQGVRLYYTFLASAPISFYWSLQNKCDGCVWLKIDARTGQLLQQGKTQFIY